MLKKTPAAEEAVRQPVDDRIVKRVTSRAEILNFALYHVAISHFEKLSGLYFERQVEFVRGETRLLLDALRQDDNLPEDIVLDVHYIRKPYLDAPIHGLTVAKKVEIYELLTGRKARGVLIVIVGRERMLEGNYLNMTRQGVEARKEKVSLEVYSCEQVGFHPGPVSAGVFATNIQNPSPPEA